MTDRDSKTLEVDWNHTETPASPLRFETRYVEVKLEHEGAEPGEVKGDYPTGIPYQSRGENRVFYWRTHISASELDTPSMGICATIHETFPLYPKTEQELELANSNGIVVDGTVAGGCRTADVSSYSEPDVRVTDITDETLYVDSPVGELCVSRNGSTIERLPEQVVMKNGDKIEITPVLTVRYPGKRLIYHPDPESDYKLFPSFGLSLEDLPNPLNVPVKLDQLDHMKLSESLGVPLDEGDFNKRILWEAFAYNAFDPQSKDEVNLAQFESGLIAVLE